MSYRIFTSESVCAGHPDKICDQISDAILDECLKQDKDSRVAVETLVTTNNIVLAGEVTTGTKVDFEKIARGIVRGLGYTQKIYNFDYKTVKVKVLIHSQAPDIAQGVETGGAGDQGMMFGYACTETPSLMPLPIMISHEITKSLDLARQKTLKYLRPDGKSQVTIQYFHGKPTKILKVVTAVPHHPSKTQDQVAKDVYEVIIRPTLKKFGFTLAFKDTVYNGTGRWEIGGPASDTGVTGRKIIVDSYGGMARIGGGAFSGKDPTKVDRSGAYAARYIAKNVVANKMARRCEIQLAYVIGRPDPISKSLETFGTENVPVEKIENFAWNLLDLSVNGIIKGLNLKRPIYKDTAAYGHFGNPKYSWEKLAA
ncbi:methionine adenosyltransferase [Candidatus Curtissbacteria bacterium]|nr:methionine adenosyltransferase [Candidatus Curtissbacteria bacterium]